MEFKEKKFNIGELKGISAKTIEEHLKLYAGYVKNTNSILEKIPVYEGYVKEDAFAPYVISELNRRFSFEYNGMRNHEIYFDSLSDGAKEITPDGELIKCIAYLWGSFDKWLVQFKTLATTRGIGWAMLYLDRKEHRLLNAWVDEQHIGQLQDCTPILALDMWEHSFVADYQPSGKKQYIEDFFTSLNWQNVEKNFSESISPEK
ncbi:MAG: Fe-Mn family superoxide dismutase [Candidatus Paceibacterota bacterium]|jgi:Fe-Mn family superoxide dismutase